MYSLQYIKQWGDNITILIGISSGRDQHQYKFEQEITITIII